MFPYILKLLNQELDEILELYVIEPSESNWSISVLYLTNHQESFISVFDGRDLNKVTKPDSYPSPRVDRIINSTGCVKFISILHLWKTFWQIPLDLASRKKTDFSVLGRSFFLFNVVPFGLCNSTQKQQRLVDRLLVLNIYPLSVI